MVSDLSDQENTFDDQETQLSILEAYVTNNTKPPVIRRNPRPGVHIYWRRRSFEYGSNDGNVDSSLAASILRCLSNNDETSLSAVHPTQLESNSTEDSAVRFSEVLSTLDCDDPASVAQHLFSILSSTNDNDQLQNELIDLFGLDQFDLVSKILSSRQAFLEDCRSCLNLLQLVSLDQTQAKKKKEPVCGQQITVHSSSDLHVRKLAKRQKKHLNKLIVKFNHQINEDGKSEWERLQNEIARNSDETVFTEQWVETSPRSQTPLPEDYPFVYNACHENNSHNYPFVYDACHGNDSQMFNFSGAELCLPNNCSRHNYGVYEEIHVPAVTAPQIKEMNQMNIDEFDDFAKKCFHGFEKLNVIQSVVFNQAYNSQENLLICAPTGAGKTNIALLSILNTLRKYLGDSKVCRNDFKIIYIAPMKALATEMTANFMNRLGKLNIRVRELTGDIKLSKKAIAETQMLVLTPEKWDVLTRKSMETPIMKLVKLLIIDEVHLLHDDRGPVIETIVARTLRQVEMSQEAIRIVGLSATLPNYVDVARFLRVNPSKGLFFFDSRFRPVPLFIGVRNPPLDEANVMREMDEICYDKVHQFVKNKHQVLVFVTARNATSKLAHTFRDQASKKGHLKDFLPANLDSPSYKSSSKSVKSCRNGMIIELFQLGFGIHHAGVPRRERLLTEKLFARGHITVLFCTSTLAWGVNLPAHAVVIRGTEIFDIHRGIYCDMGVLDVQQIFGRAGRPQYETAGHGIVITWKRNLSKYLNMLLRQAPIESQFISRICDNLNAEVALGTVLSISEAVEWLKYTYFFIRAKLNPLAYGIPHSHLSRDPELSDFLTHVVTEAAKKLDMNEMIRFDEINGYVVSTDLGRIASNYYIRYETIEIFLNSSTEVKLQPIMTDDMILMLIASATEFSQVKLRDEEFAELQELANICPLRLKRGVLSTVCGKVNCLMQAHISRAGIRTYSLLSESQFVQGNSDRLCRAVFEIALKKGWAQAANGALVLAKCLDRQIWVFQTPLRQLDFIRMDWINKIERKNLRYYQLYEMSEKELGSMLNCDGRTIYQAVRMLPVLLVDAAIKPVTSTIIQVSVTVTPDFQWYDNFHGPMNGLVFWIFVEDIDENFILHHDQVLLSKKKVRN
ncbi:unnamed protein product, partial [Thelazia callipaeda]|uniref:U5 small nuclear ribonucleoprotein 200 kDa helicase n=1 Tax=Thelazia callipaeda TaxID=103827 RepID=A0A0N5CKS4_THECL